MAPTLAVRERGAARQKEPPAGGMVAEADTDANTNNESPDADLAMNDLFRPDDIAGRSVFSLSSKSL